MQNIINSLSKINFEHVESFEGVFKELPEFEINDDYSIFSIEKKLKESHNIFPYIIFDLKNYKDEYIFKCLDLLDKFYESRDTEHCNRLVIENILDNYRYTTKIIIKPIFSDCLILEDKESKENTLKIQKQEFKEFGLFLNSQNLK